jgi:hypothetical protein
MASFFLPTEFPRVGARLSGVPFLKNRGISRKVSEE